MCTAGIDSDGNFLRLYPFPFRMMDTEIQFSKYQWIEVDIEKSTRDPRPESYKAYPSTVVLGEKVSPKNWEERRRIVGQLEIDTLCGLKKNCKNTTKTLSIIKPKKVDDLIVKATDRDWTGREKEYVRIISLLDQSRPPLKKMPYEFKYKFSCEHPDCKGHEMKIGDWELTALYWNLIHGKESEESALKKVKDKFLGELCSVKRDVHFFVGTHSSYQTWMIIGLFSPPRVASKKKTDQFSLL